MHRRNLSFGAFAPVVAALANLRRTPTPAETAAMRIPFIEGHCASLTELATKRWRSANTHRGKRGKR
jgi:hypothetical protein